MKYLTILLALMIVSCKQQTADDQTNNNNNSTTVAPGENRTSEIPDKTMSDTAKQLLIDISNIAWIQVHASDLVLSKSHDAKLLTLARYALTNYTRVKDKAKIVSIPYRLNMPYFLTHDQNLEINQLDSASDKDFKSSYLSVLNNNNALLTSKCAALESVTNSASDMMPMIEFARSVVDSTTKQIGTTK